MKKTYKSLLHDHEFLSQIQASLITAALKHTHLGASLTTGWEHDRLSKAARGYSEHDPGTVLRVVLVTESADVPFLRPAEKKKNRKKIMCCNCSSVNTVGCHSALYLAVPRGYNDCISFKRKSDLYSCVRPVGANRLCPAATDPPWKNNEKSKRWSGMTARSPDEVFRGLHDWIFVLTHRLSTVLSTWTACLSKIGHAYIWSWYICSKTSACACTRTRHCWAALSSLSQLQSITRVSLIGFVRRYIAVLQYMCSHLQVGNLKIMSVDRGYMEGITAWN